MAEKVFYSLDALRREYAPRVYQERLIKEKRYPELVSYLVENDIELYPELMSGVNDRDLEKFMATIFMKKLLKKLGSSKCLVE